MYLHNTYSYIYTYIYTYSYIIHTHIINQVLHYVLLWNRYLKIRTINPSYAFSDFQLHVTWRTLQIAGTKYVPSESSGLYTFFLFIYTKFRRNHNVKTRQKSLLTSLLLYALSSNMYVGFKCSYSL